jgi:hypothetical protein
VYAKNVKILCKKMAQRLDMAEKIVNFARIGICGLVAG